MKRKRFVEDCKDFLVFPLEFLQTPVLQENYNDAVEHVRFEPLFAIVFIHSLLQNTYNCRLFKCRNESFPSTQSQ